MKGFAAALSNAVLALVCAVLLPATTAEAAWPDRTIKFVVPFPPGGSTDISARVLAERLAKRLGTTIIIENQPGASGLIGASTVVRAKPDGYTLLVTSNGLHSAAATGKANFQLKSDLVPVSEMVGGALIIVASKNAPFTDIKGFVEHAKKNPKKVDVAITAALGAAHITFENFRRAAGIQYEAVYYNGESPALLALVSGVVPATIVAAPVARPFIEDGRLVGLAVTTGQRFSLLPNVPTLAETVVPGFADGYSSVMFAPKDTPDEIIQRLSREIAEVLKEPETVLKLRELGMVPIASTPAQYASKVSTDFDRNTQVIKDLRESGQVKD